MTEQLKPCVMVPRELLERVALKAPFSMTGRTVQTLKAQGVSLMSCAPYSPMRRQGSRSR